MTRCASEYSAGVWSRVSGCASPRSHSTARASPALASAMCDPSHSATTAVLPACTCCHAGISEGPEVHIQVQSSLFGSKRWCKQGDRSTGGQEDRLEVWVAGYTREARSVELGESCCRGLTCGPGQAPTRPFPFCAADGSSPTPAASLSRVQRRSADQHDEPAGRMRNTVVVLRVPTH